MTVDANRNMKMISTYDWNHGTPMNGKEMRRMNSGLYQGQVEHKYDYSANQFDVRTWGWSSTAGTSASVRQSERGIFERRADEVRAVRAPRRDIHHESHRRRAADAAQLLARQPLRREPVQHRRERGLDEGDRAVLIYCNTGATPETPGKMRCAGKN